MIGAVNRVYEHAGKQYHLQAEDLGEEQASFEVRVFTIHTVEAAIAKGKLGA